MLTSDKIINGIAKANNGNVLIKRTGKEEDFVKSYVEFRKYSMSLTNKKNKKGTDVNMLDAELHSKYNNFMKYCSITWL